MRTASDIVRAYLTAFTAGDLATARALVSENIVFEGPRGGTEGRDDFFAASAWIIPFLRGVRILRQWEAGDDVSTLYEYDVEAPAGAGCIRISEWSTVRDGQLVSAVAVFDAAAAHEALMSDSSEAA